MARSRSLPITTRRQILGRPQPTSSCVSTSSDFYSVQPIEKPYPPVVSKVKQEAIFSFEWSGTDPDCTSSMSVPVAQIVNVKGDNGADMLNRHLPPSLPPPLFHSTLLHDEIFDAYIKAEVLGVEVRPTVSIRPGSKNSTGSTHRFRCHQQRSGCTSVF